MAAGGTLQHGHELAIGGRADDLPPMAVLVKVVDICVCVYIYI